MASITCHECRVRHEICDHLSFKEFDKLRAENERLRAFVASFVSADANALDADEVRQMQARAVREFMPGQSDVDPT